MKKVVINEQKTRVVIAGPLKLLPGANEVEEHFLDPKHPSGKLVAPMLKDLEKQGKVSIPEPEVEDDFADDFLGQYGVADAVKLVQQTVDYDTLMRYQTEEMAGKKRPQVLDMIAKQIKASEDALNSNEN